MVRGTFALAISLKIMPDLYESLQSFAKVNQEFADELDPGGYFWATGKRPRQVLCSFAVPVSFALDDQQADAAKKALNLHYLGDENCNELDTASGYLKPKYPDKETEAFKEAHGNFRRTSYVELVIDLLEDGTLKARKLVG